MIGFLRGTVRDKQPPLLLLEVNGVGYEVNAPMSVFFQLPLNQEPIQLYTHLVVREDAHTLYGFLTPADQQWFRSLIKVNGVGPRMALAILSSMQPRQFALSITHQDIALLTKIPGVGKKTAERLVIELQEKSAKWLQETPADEASSDKTSSLSQSTLNLSAAQVTAPDVLLTDVIQDAQHALIALGFKPADASRSVRSVHQPGMSSEALIKAALKDRVPVS